MEENKIEVEKEGSEAKKGRCFGFKCHGGADCGHKCHRIAKASLIVLAALVLLCVGASFGRHGNSYDRFDRGDRFDRSYRAGAGQEGAGCGAQNNFRGTQGNQENGFRGGRGMMRGYETQTINSGSQINMPADILPIIQPAVVASTTPVTPVK